MWMLLEQFLNKQLIDMHDASNIMKPGNKFIFVWYVLHASVGAVL
jgi:hypothetical protein